MPEERLITSIPLLQKHAARLEDENWAFRSYIKSRLKMDDEELDEVVRARTEEVWSQISCIGCFNCCIALQPTVDSEDCERLAKRFGLSAKAFRQHYVTKDQFGDEMLNSMPCPFHSENGCTVYEDRPRACADYPYLYSKGFRQRLMGVIQNTAVCPVVFNTVEKLKEDLRFRKKGRDRR